MNIKELAERTGWSEREARTILANTRGFVIKGDTVTGSQFAWGRSFDAEEYLRQEKEASLRDD